jgi:DNA-binding NarL/FixJ family response regulator
MADALLFPWNTLLQLQRATDSGFVCAQTHARDEALTDIVDGLCSGMAPSDAESMLRRYWGLAANRAKKYRHRAELDRLLAGRADAGENGDQAEVVALREQLARILRGLPRGERELLCSISSGMTYREIAIRLGRPSGTIKSRVSRLRRYLREACVKPAVGLGRAA